MSDFPTTNAMANILRRVAKLDDKLRCAQELMNSGFTRFEIVKNMDSAILVESLRRDKIAATINRASAA